MPGGAFGSTMFSTTRVDLQLTATDARQSARPQHRPTSDRASHMAVATYATPHPRTMDQRMMRVVAAIGMMPGTTSWSAQAWAYRPFDSTDAEVAKPGELEFEIGPVGYLVAEGERFLVAPAIIGNAGLVDRVELVLEGRNRIRTTP